jgi:hypothetical protein
MEIVMKQAEQASEPPSWLSPPIFMIGRDSKGHWVAQEQGGLRGGLFVNRAEATKYARFESGNDPHAVVMVSGVLELDTVCAGARSLQQRHAEITRHHRRVA